MSFKLISDNYRQQNEILHQTTHYGVTAPRYARKIKAMARRLDAANILDYGSGTRRHVKKMFWFKKVESYDPCVPELSAAPRPADFLVCCDVLEHIEPDCLDDVLSHMQSLAQRGVFLSISTRKANKILPDGRNAHLIVEGADFWLPLLMARWRLERFEAFSDEIVCEMRILPKSQA